MFRIAAVLIALAGLSACGGTPVNYGTPITTARIGIVNIVDENPKHFHVGTTITDNFERQMATDSDFRSRFTARSSDVLSQAGYPVQTIQPTQLLWRHRYDLFDFQSKNIDFKTNIEAEINRMAAAANVDFLVLVYPVSGPVWADAATYIDGYGLYTECLLRKCSSRALTYVDARIYDIQNQAALKRSEFQLFENPTMPDSYVVQDPKRISSDMVDTGAAIAVDSYALVFESMLRTSEFIE